MDHRNVKISFQVLTCTIINDVSQFEVTETVSLSFANDVLPVGVTSDDCWATVGGKCLNVRKVAMVK